MKKANPSQYFLALAVGISLVSGFLGGVGAVWVLEAEVPQRSFGGTQDSFEDAWTHSAESVVSIVAMKELQQFYDRFEQPTSSKRPATSVYTEVSSGTAFLVEPGGLAVTNRHVVEEEDVEYVAILSDGSELSVEVLARDSANDIAIIQIDPGNFGVLPYLDLADSSALNVGQAVMAIGNALGEYSHTATSGIISGLDRSILTASSFGKIDSLIDLIQTDAAINSGNSGGPLLNLDGDVVGMNTAVDTQGDGIGFAIPSNAISQSLDSYKKYGEIVRPELGVHFVIIDGALAQRFSLPFDYGAYLLGDRKAAIPAVFPGGSAEAAGLLEGDLILKINNKEITRNYTLDNALLPYDVGETVLLELWRDGELLEVELAL